VAGGKNIGRLSIGVDLDADKAQRGLATLSAEVNALGASITNMGKNFASSFAAGFGVGSLTQIVSDLGSKLAEITKWAGEFQGRMDAVSARMKDAFDIDISRMGIAKLAIETSQSIEQIAAAMEKLGKSGISADDAKYIVKGAAQRDSGFGGKGESAKSTGELLEKLRGQFKASADDLQMFENRGVKVYSKLAELMGTTVAEAKELAKAGKIGADEAAAAVAGAQAQIDKKKVGVSAGPGGYGTVEVAGFEANRKFMESLLPGIQLSRLEKRASELSEKLKTESERLAEELAEITTEIQKSSKLTDPKAVQALDTLKRYQESLKEKLDEINQTEIDGILDGILAGIEEKRSRIESLMTEGMDEYELFAKKNLEMLKRFDEIIETLEGEQRQALLNAKDRALRKANEQADSQFMDANQKLANRMNELQENLKKAQAAGDMQAVERYKAALANEAKSVIALGTQAQGSNLASVNEYGSQGWAQSMARAWDTDNRSEADRYKEGLDKLNDINTQTGKDTKRIADAVEKLGIPQPVSLGRR